MDQEITPPELLMPQAVPSRAAHNLANKNAGVFSAQTVERYVFESYASLRRTARIHTHLTALAIRFAGDRLTALAQSQGTWTGRSRTPVGQPLEAVRVIRDDLDGRVRQLLADLTSPSLSA